MIPNLAASVPSRRYSSVVPVSGSVAPTALPMFDAVVTAASPSVSLKVRVVLSSSVKVGGLFSGVCACVPLGRARIAAQAARIMTVRVAAIMLLILGIEVLIVQSSLFLWGVALSFGLRCYHPGIPMSESVGVRRGWIYLI